MITRNVRSLLAELPPGTILVAAAKNRTPREVMAAVQAGITTVGENYLQDAKTAYALLGNCVCWHFIGSLQKNKVRAAVNLFDMIETVGSLASGRAIDAEAAGAGKIMPVLIEVNSGRESQKGGALPEEVEGLLMQLARLNNIRVQGLMTMGPKTNNPEELRPYFRQTRHLFDSLKKLGLSGVDLRYLSMGMSDSYHLAIEEGANIVRLGTRIFGPRKEV